MSAPDTVSSDGVSFDAVSFDALSEDSLRAAGSLKWTKYGTAIGAFVAEMDVGTAPVVTRALHEAVDAAAFGYLPAAVQQDLAAACARWQAERYGWAVPAARVAPLADVVAGLTAAIDHFTPPGAPVVLPTPAYMPFLRVPGERGREVVQVPMVPGADGRPTYDLAGIDRALAGGGLFVHVNPHNPLGRVFTEAEQLGLAEVVARRGARVFADEIHAPLVYRGQAHRPYASLSPVTAGHTVTATSASKAWNLPGLKCAQLLLSNDADAARWAEVGERPEHGCSTLGAIANTVAFTEGGPWLDEVLHHLDGSRRMLADLLAEHLPRVRYTPPEGTYLAWLDCRELGVAEPLGEFFRREAGVALIDGTECGAAGAGHVRLTLATPRPVLRAIVQRMAAAVG
ncbi:MalY/PatB family protein [Modestobacter roseus]|uniref:cysteine-S-conjugate beta-lyase n=1 Tax=Modestobacter roseus TaxID=1181884 RepID=A0A562IWD6_9ACTN|nr:aminotransferase class I/II-fold pyridoxal phosphate-dependent enzyme [Modestobacter roseus]MQA35867.1 aminotransferase class I/II-fold pyridoxal phosphate-dependent enzyme [Modestobacter roseus]TWH75166.1 cystathionine beta-lyase [Modestobacter roseus]